MNLLGQIGYSNKQFFSVSTKPNTATQLFWAEVSQQWLQLASGLEVRHSDLALDFFGWLLGRGGEGFNVAFLQLRKCASNFLLHVSYFLVKPLS